MRSENREFLLNRHVTLDEVSMVKPVISQPVETMKTKLVVLQRVESDATPCCPIGSVLFGISSVVTPGGDPITDMETGHVGKVDSVAARRAEGNPRKWIVKKHGSQADEVQMTQSIGFDAAKMRVG